MAVRAAAIAVTCTALFLPPHELSLLGHRVDERFTVLLGAMVRAAVK